VIERPIHMMMTTIVSTRSSADGIPLVPPAGSLRAAVRPGNPQYLSATALKRIDHSVGCVSQTSDIGNEQMLPEPNPLISLTPFFVIKRGATPALSRDPRQRATGPGPAAGMRIRARRFRQPRRACVPAPGNAKAF
jgi:hypothetical protein